MSTAESYCMSAMSKVVFFDKANTKECAVQGHVQG